MTGSQTTGTTGADPHPSLSPNAMATPLRLRSQRPSVKRLSRRVMFGGTAIIAVVVSAAVLWALQKDRARETAVEKQYSIDHRTVADGLSGLPRDYAGVPRDVPRLGPPLPGDLGRPIVAAQVQSEPFAVDPEQQRINQESEAARTSKVFAPTNVRHVAASVPLETAANAGASSDETIAQNGQDRKLAFVSAAIDRRTTSPDRVTRPASKDVVQAGSVIAAALITGIRSDLPGQIMAHVTEPVFDSPSGQVLLVPQGARLIGVYDSQISTGQSRVLLVWTRLILPNGRSIVLERQPGADGAGYAGLQDQVDQHWGNLFQAATLSTLLGIGAEIGAGTDTGSGSSPILQALRRGASGSLNQTGQQVVRRNLNVQPTLTVRPGFPVRVIVNRDLVLEPYRG